MGIRPNKTNFGLSFGHFWRPKREREKKKRRREEEKKKEKIWNLCVETSFVWNNKDLYGIVWFVWIHMGLV